MPAVAKASNAKAAVKAPEPKAATKAAAKAKTGEPIAPAVSNVSAETVWYQVDPGEWAPCKVVSREPNGGLRLKVKNKDVAVSPSDAATQVLPRSGQKKLLQNLAELPRDGLGPAGIEDVLRQHLCNSTPYTNIADVLLLVNPMREIPIYDSKWIDKYSSMDSTLPPHVYNASAMAYKTLTEKKSSQAILITGRPGSGKSRAVGHLLAFLVHTAGSGEELDQLIGQVEVVLRPLLSIRLENGLLNWLSTRALLKLELSFDEDDFICRSVATVQLMESRAARPGDGANFDAFGRALRDRTEAKQWLGEKEEFKLLGEEFDLEEYDSSGRELEEWKKALEMFKIDSALVVRILCGLLLLGEVTFNGQATAVTCTGHEEAAKALGIDAAALAEGLVQAGDAEAADGVLRDTIEDIYRSLVMWILQKVNAAMVGDSEPVGPTISIVDTPAFPSGWPATLSAPTGFDAFQLQWFTQAMKSLLLNGALQGKIQEQVDFGTLDTTRLDSIQAAEAALQVIAGRDGLATKIRELAKLKTLPTKKDLAQWGATFAEQATCVSVKTASVDVSCEITGAGGKVNHVLDNALVRGSLGPSMPKKVRRSFATSSLKPVREILASRMEPVAVGSDMDEAEKTVSMVRAMLEGREKVRPWLVCCMRPNDKGSDKLVSQSVLQAQVEELLLCDVVHMAGQTKVPYSVAWSLATFQKQYAALMPNTRTDSLEACRTLIKATGSGQGTVGAIAVYGPQDLLKSLDAKAPPAAASPKDKGAKVEQATAKAGVRPSAEPAKAAVRPSAETPQERQRPSVEPAAGAFRYFRFTPIAARSPSNAVQVCGVGFSSKGRALPLKGAVATNPGGSNDGRFYSKGPDKTIDGDLKTKWRDYNKGMLIIDFKAPVHADQFSFTTAQDRPERDPVSWRIEGSQDSLAWILLLERIDYETPTLRKTRTEWFPLESAPQLCPKCKTPFANDSKKSCSKCGTKRPAAAAPINRTDKINDGVAAALPSLPSESDKRGPLRSMALSQHATLHAALSQMAAVLRVAKESETNLQKSQVSRESEVQELKQECESWRIESDRLWVQVKELQQMVQEGNVWRPPLST